MKTVINANSVDPDQTPRSAASDQDLRCLPMSNIGTLGIDVLIYCGTEINKLDPTTKHFVLKMYSILYLSSHHETDLTVCNIRTALTVHVLNSSLLVI